MSSRRLQRSITPKRVTTPSTSHMPHQNRSNSIGSIAYENGKVDIIGVLCNEVAGQENKKTAVYHQPDTTNRHKAMAKTDGEFTTVNTNVARQDG